MSAETQTRPPRSRELPELDAEQEIDLALEARRVVVPFDRGMADAGPVVPRVGTHHTQHTLEIRDLVGVLHCRLRPWIS